MDHTLLRAALSSSPPLLTDDPVVNHAVDCHEDDRSIPYDAELYENEILVWKKSGGLVLSYS